jgi:hypothetical protein
MLLQSGGKVGLHTHTRKHARTHIYTHTHIHTNTHTHTHTHKQVGLRFSVFDHVTAVLAGGGDLSTTKRLAAGATAGAVEAVVWVLTPY